MYIEPCVAMAQNQHWLSYLARSVQNSKMQRTKKFQFLIIISSVSNKLEKQTCS